MNRQQKKWYKRKVRLKVLLGIFVCLVLFCCGLSIVDASSRDMLGRKDDKPIFGIYDLGGQIIKLEFAGGQISIDKREWKAAYESVKERMERLIGRQRYSEGK